METHQKQQIKKKKTLSQWQTMNHRKSRCVITWKYSLHQIMPHINGIYIVPTE